MADKKITKKLEEELEEYNETKEDYKDKIKNECCICGAHFTNNWEYYLKNGNKCPKCKWNY